MEYQKHGETYVLRLNRGEEVVESLRALCEQEHIALASVTGIGAVGELTTGLFHTAEKQYAATDLRGDFEIVSLAGNVTQQDGAVYLHLHIAVADETQLVRGGHLNRAVVSATAEIFVTPYAGTVGRVFSEEIGLNLMDFGA